MQLVHLGKDHGCSACLAGSSQQLRRHCHLLLLLQVLHVVRAVVMVLYLGS
jgi:hypothetical protein